MKTKKMTATVFASMLMLLICFTARNSFAQTKSDMKMKDGGMMQGGCMMQGGKMMDMKDGKTMPMEHNMTMMNGTTCLTNGECTMKDGKKIMMKEGDCMDMNGMMDKCGMLKNGSMMKDSSMMKDGCLMQGGKMMGMKDGKTMPMEHNMIMMNGTTCQTNGECTMKDGKKIMMKEGDCMDMNGKIGKCSMMSKDAKSTTETKKENKSSAVIWTCPMHPQIKENNPGKCPICGMDLVKKK
jgi:hypothetical protein